MIVIFLLFCIFSYVKATVPFTFTDCNTSPNKILHIEKVHLSQDPILILRNETVFVEVEILKPIAANQFTANLAISKKILFGWVAIPCLSDLKSQVCHFELCDYLRGKHLCPVELEQSSPDMLCACPFKPGFYRINHTSLNMYHHLTPVFQNIVQGDFKATMTVVDRNTNETVGCLQIHASVAHLGTSIFG